MPIPAELQKAWDEATELLEVKNDPEGALEALRSAWGSIDNEAQRAKTLSLAADAGTELGVIDKRNQKSHWQKAYKNYNKSLSIDPKNKETRRNMNKLASMMDEQSISLGLGLQMFDQGNPTPLGLLVMVLSMAVFLVSIKLVSDYLGDDSNPIVSLEVQYTLNGQSVTGEIQIELYEDEAPMHVESMLIHARNFQYDGGQFHRVIEGFMIQGGDIQNMGGSGGYAADYYGYCNGVQTPESECRQKEDYTIPFEHENGLKHTAGAVAAAHAGKNTDGSQFYIVPSDGFAEFLDYDEFPAKDCWGDLTPNDPEDDGSCHTVFGYVISGIEHVDAISQVDTVDPDARPSDDRPVDPVRIISVTVL